MNAYRLREQRKTEASAAGTSLKRRIAGSFGLKSSVYDANAVVQRKLIKKLCSAGLRGIADKEVWVDLGCGTGLFGRECASRGTGVRSIGLDLAIEPLRYMKKAMKGGVSAVRGDIDALPFKRGVFDGAVLASTLQWLDDPLGAVPRIAALLRAHGRLLFAIYVSGSFCELIRARSLFALAAPAKLFSPVQLTEAFFKAGLELIHHEIVRTTLYFPDALTLLKSISGIGAAVTAQRPLSRSGLSDFCDAYERMFRAPRRGVPLTYRAMLGVCRKRD